MEVEIHSADSKWRHKGCLVMVIVDAMLVIGIVHLLIQFLKLLGNLFRVGVGDLAADGAAVVQPDKEALPEHVGERLVGVNVPVHVVNRTVAFRDEGGYLFTFVSGKK